MVYNTGCYECSGKENVLLFCHHAYVLMFTSLRCFAFTWIYLTSTLHFNHIDSWDNEQCLAHKSANKALAAPENHRMKLQGIYSSDTVELGELFWFSDLTT